MNKIKILKFNNHIENKTAIIHRFNAYFRVLDGDNKESFFYSLDKAILELLNQGYLISLNM